jgi:hypothetical protein
VSQEGLALSDEWWFPAKDDGGFRRQGDWWVFEQGDGLMAVQALSVYEAGAGEESWRPANAVPHEEEDGVRLTVPLLGGSPGYRVSERVEVAWVVRVLDAAECGNVKEVLSSITVTDLREFDYTLPRVEEAYVRTVRVSEGTREVNLRVDYHRDLWG